MKSILAILVVLLAVTAASADDVKEADLAGSWYPRDKQELTYLLESYLQNANPEPVKEKVFAIISPHAGYQFSGPVAAYGFKAVQGKDIKTAIVIGFSHRKYLDGVSVYDRSRWTTPLGDIQVDGPLAKAIIAGNPRIVFEPRLFRDENSVEMQIPFVQLVFKNAKIVPIAFGTQNYRDAEILADVLATALKDRDDVLIVASTDMSHYHPYDAANAIDRRAINLLSKMRARELYDESLMRSCELCGIMPVTATVLAAQKLGYDNVKILKYANSGDTFGAKDSVVGYLSAEIYGKGPQGTTDVKKTEGKMSAKEEKSAMLNYAQRKKLLQIARESITGYVRDGKRKAFAESDPVLNKEMGAFVTLHENGQLRGCIGNMVAQGPLYETVANMAIEAATGDPRFPRLSAAEINNIDIEISVLSPLKRVSSAAEINIPGHGVLVKRGFRSGVYLPQVATEAGWGKEEFLTSLCAHKAGLPANAWMDPATEMYTFNAEVFGEKGESR